MDVPQELRIALEHQIKGTKLAKMRDDAQELSNKYRAEIGNGKPLITLHSEVVAYAAARMPATLQAVSFALKQVINSTQYNPQTMLDVGAGTGAASWAAEHELNLKSITCLEREGAMREVGEAMMQQGCPLLRNAKWINDDLNSNNNFEKADLVIASYVLNEMTDEDQLKTAQKLWDATNMILLIIEPGTPVGFAHIKRIRQALLANGAYVAAPCTHNDDCPMKENDWCHFTCRVNRTQLHRQLKGGDAPFEDEKFAYMAFTREKFTRQDARILRHPQVRKGHVMFEVCTNDGIKNITLSQKDKAKYKKAKKAKTGDLLQY
ncbi:MAG: rRNA methyltransferase [Kiritimatiellae bacterium]|jgi:ribosomal protein RSM22 (predicted rRNA methylase)|nr:rRNA methyltransferase [Kiritimatiellia bacterium]